MRRALTYTSAVVALGIIWVGSAGAAIRHSPSRTPDVFPRVVREDFVRRLAANAPPIAVVEPTRDYRPRCCFEATHTSVCRVGTAAETCWLDAGDGCGPESGVDDLAGYWPEDVRKPKSGTRWGEVARDEQGRSIRAILQVLAERQPAKPVGLAAYALGYIESGFNPTAIHPRTQACGLYQFLRGTWSDFARAEVAHDPMACQDPRENAATAVRFLTHLYDAHHQEIIDQEPAWETMEEWERVTTVYLGLYAMHNYGENHPRWQDPENGARQIALAHLGVLKHFYDSLQDETVRMQVADRRAVSRRGGRRR